METDHKQHHFLGDCSQVVEEEGAKGRDDHQSGHREGL